MPLYRITGEGKKTGRKRVRVYEADTQEEAFKKAYSDETIIDGAATEIIPYPPATERQLDYARSLGIDCPEGISQKEISNLIDEAKKWASPRQIRLAEELELKLPQKKMTVEQMSDFLDKALQDRIIRKRYEKLPPTKDQLRKAKELGVRVPWRATRQRLSALLDNAIEKQKEEVRKRDIAGYKDRLARDDGNVRGRFIHDNAAFEALNGLLGDAMILPGIKLSTRIHKGDRRGNVNAQGDTQSAKKVRDFYAKLLRMRGFTVINQKPSFFDSQKRTASYALDFKQEKSGRLGKL